MIDHINNTLNKHSILINQIKANLQNNLILLYNIYDMYIKGNFRIIKIEDIYVKSFLSEDIRKKHIIKTFNDNKKNREKYFMTVNFTRNKPIAHPFFIYHCLSEKFVKNFVSFVLDRSLITICSSDLIIPFLLLTELSSVSEDFICII